MDGRLGGIVVKPDQFMLVSVVIGLILLPVFEKFVYPYFEKIAHPITVLRRLGLGCAMVIIAFIMSGILELQLEVYTIFTKCCFIFACPALLDYCNVSLNISSAENIRQDSKCMAHAFEFRQHAGLPNSVQLYQSWNRQHNNFTVELHDALQFGRTETLKHKRKSSELSLYCKT